MGHHIEGYIHLNFHQDCIHILDMHTCRCTSAQAYFTTHRIKRTSEDSQCRLTNSSNVHVKLQYPAFDINRFNVTFCHIMNQFIYIGDLL